MSCPLSPLRKALALFCATVIGCSSAEKPTGVTPTPPPTTPRDTTTPPVTGQLNISPIENDGIGIEPGGAKRMTIGMSGPLSFVGVVTVAVTSPVAGLTVETRQPTLRSGIAVTEITALATTSVPAGTYTLSLNASAAGLTSATRTFPVTVRPIGLFTLVPAPAPRVEDTLAVAPGGELVANPGVTRFNYPAPITLRAEGVPPGIEVVFPQSTFDASVYGVRIRALSTTPVGTYTFTWRATAPGLSDRTAIQRVNVQDFGAYSYQLAPDTVVAAPGQTVTAYLRLTKRQVGRYSISPSLSVDRLQPGISLVVPGSSPDSVPVIVSVAPGTPAGRYTNTILSRQVYLAQQQHVIPVRVAATPNAALTVSLDFSLCLGTEVPVWVAYQDGTGAWQRATGAANVYRFPITAATGSYAIVRGYISGTTMRVEMRTASRAALLSQSVVFCGSPRVGEQDYGGTVVGPFNSFDNMNITLGSHLDMVPGAYLYGPPSVQSFNMLVLGGFSRALVGWRSSGASEILAGLASPDRGYIRRNATPSNTRSFGTIDLLGADSFDPIAAELQVASYPTSEALTLRMGYVTDAGCDAAPLATNSPEAFGDKTKVMARGVPTSRQVAGDLHSVLMSLTDNSGGFFLGRSERTAREYSRLLVPRTIAMPTLATATVSAIPAQYSRLSATVSVPPEYNRSVRFEYGVGARIVQIEVDRSAITGTSTVITMPDFSAAPGWSNTFAPTNGSTGTWKLLAGGDNLAYPGGCTDGSRVVQSMLQGRY